MKLVIIIILSDADGCFAERLLADATTFLLIFIWRFYLQPCDANFKTHTNNQFQLQLQLVLVRFDLLITLTIKFIALLRLVTIFIGLYNIIMINILSTTAVHIYWLYGTIHCVSFMQKFLVGSYMIQLYVPLFDYWVCLLKT